MKKPAKSRKEARKQGRVEQKQKKAQFFSTGKRRSGEVDEPALESQPRKKARVGEGDGSSSNNGMRDQSSTSLKDVKASSSSAQMRNVDKGMDRSKLDKRERKVAEVKEKEKNTVVVVPPRGRVEEEEDAYIAYLEKRLGYSKQKQKKQSSLEEDGLDGEFGYCLLCLITEH